MKQGIARSLDKLESIGKSLDLEGKKKQVEKNNAMMAEPDFWNDQKKAQKLIRETNSMKTLIDGQESLVSELKDLNESVAENSTYPSREGYPVGAIFAYKTDGLDKDGYPVFVGKEGERLTATEFFRLNRFGASTLSAEEQRGLYTYMGTEEPKCSGGFINTFELGDWQLNLNFMFNLGMKVRVQPSYSPTYFDRGQNTNKDILNRWTTTNTGAKLPGLMVSTAERANEYTHYSEYNTYSMLDIWVRDRNYCRLQSVRLAYRIPKSILAPIGISSASVSLEGRNLFVLSSDYDNYLDPETMGNPYAQPITRSFIFGLNVNF